MKKRFIVFERRNGVFYCEDTETKKQTSLQTRDRRTAERLINARNESLVQPSINLQIARAYLTATDPAMNTRTWSTVIQEIVSIKQGETQRRWTIAAKDQAFQSLLSLTVLETRPEHLMAVLKKGTVSTNVYLRRIHNFALGMNWLPWPIIPKRMWPAVRYVEKRAITAEEHTQIVAREKNPERHAFYELLWHLGGSQGDIATLQATDINWQDRVICFERQKVRWRHQTPPRISFGPAVERILCQLPQTGPLFPYLATVRACDRATEFKQRCDGLGIKGVTLHSYRYAWAERALKSGYPERYAQEALGHNSRAVHRAYSRKAQVTVPSLEEYESEQERKIVRFSL